MKIDRVCGTGGCMQEAISFIGKFGETRNVGAPVNTPPGIPISIAYCAEHEESSKRFLAAL
jgi:hypothetical protein